MVAWQVLSRDGKGCPWLIREVVFIPSEAFLAAENIRNNEQGAMCEDVETLIVEIKVLPNSLADRGRPKMGD